jgi:hypothetical protein
MVAQVSHPRACRYCHDVSGDLDLSRWGRTSGRMPGDTTVADASNRVTSGGLRKDALP